MAIWSQNQVKQSYNMFINVFENSYSSNTGGFVGVKPFSWSHACTTVDLTTGRVTNVINGILTHDVNITSKDFVDNVPEAFDNNLALGVVQWKSQGSPDVNKQSEASVTNLNIFSDHMSISKIIQIYLSIYI